MSNKETSKDKIIEKLSELNFKLAFDGFRVYHYKQKYTTFTVYLNQAYEINEFTILFNELPDKIDESIDGLYLSIIEELIIIKKMHIKLLNKELIS